MCHIMKLWEKVIEHRLTLDTSIADRRLGSCKEDPQYRQFIYLEGCWKSIEVEEDTIDLEKSSTKRCFGEP